MALTLETHEGARGESTSNCTCFHEHYERVRCFLRDRPVGEGSQFELRKR
jgi:hypothetical protein